jgi:hypothetical protein
MRENPRAYGSNGGQNEGDGVFAGKLDRHSSSSQWESQEEQQNSRDSIRGHRLVDLNLMNVLHHLMGRIRKNGVNDIRGHSKAKGGKQRGQRDWDIRHIITWQDS